jgi:hypothetical protein
MVSFQILDGSYLGYVVASVISLNDRKRSTKCYEIPLSMGNLGLPGSSEEGSVRLNRRGMAITFALMEGGVRIIKVDIPQFGRHRQLRGEVVLTPLPEAESLVTHMPWRNGKNAFILSRRSPCYVAEGVMQLGAEENVFVRGNSWGILDWNRGIRPKADVHTWAVGCGLAPEGRIGFSLGAGAADDSLGTENGFFLEGRLHKLKELICRIPPGHGLALWRFSSSDGRLEMDFQPHQERVERHRFLFQSLNRRQFCGTFSGRIALDGGPVIYFRNITGFAETRRTRD